MFLFFSILYSFVISLKASNTGLFSSDLRTVSKSLISCLMVLRDKETNEVNNKLFSNDSIAKFQKLNIKT